MNCQQCSTINPDDGKFCKECGARLGAHIPTEPVDDMSGELLDLWRCYDAGQLDEALSHAEDLLDKMPDSASARSVVALVWERKSERELAAGNLEGGVAALKRAISEYEAILRLNPGSAADKSKLAVLKRKLSGDSSEPKAPRKLHLLRYSLQWPPRNIPVPAIAAAGAFVFVIVVGSLLFGGSGKPAAQPAVPDQGQQYAQPTYDYPATNTNPQQPPQYSQPPVNEQPQQAYAPPQPQNPPQTQYRPNPGTRRSYGSTRPNNYVPPYPLPNLGSEYSIVPDSSPTRRPKPTPKAQEDVIETQPPTPVAPVEAPQDEAPTVPNDRREADTMLVRARQFQKIDKKEMAAAAAQQAVSLYESEIRAGRDVERCRKGLDNAKRLLALLKETPEEQ